MHKSIDFASLLPHIDKTFDTRKAKAVALIINSPGGAPVQSHLIANYIQTLSKEKSIPVYAFVEDIAASGGYMLACAAEEIYANPVSILGSIGVISASFGFPGLLEKLGIERRVYTAGQNKSMLDPFLPENPKDITHLKSLQLSIHDFFISFVRERRGDKLKDIQEDLFTGAFWVGKDVLDRGLIDGFGSMHTVLKEKFGKDIKLIPIQTDKKSLISYLMGKAEASSSLFSMKETLSTLEERAHWKRFGL